MYSSIIDWIYSFVMTDGWIRPLVYLIRTPWAVCNIFTNNHITKISVTVLNSIWMQRRRRWRSSNFTTTIVHHWKPNKRKVLFLTTKVEVSGNFISVHFYKQFFKCVNVFIFRWKELENYLLKSQVWRKTKQTDLSNEVLTLRRLGLHSPEFPHVGATSFLQEPHLSHIYCMTLRFKAVFLIEKLVQMNLARIERLAIESG